jgi:RHS repeat-associated protein
VFAEGELIAIGRHVSGSTFEYTTLHKDALGSVTALAEIEYLSTTQSFDAWGKRRDEAAWTGGPPSAGSIPSFPTIDRRGYTGHEHLDNLELIHMNGRVYDPAIGRFLSPDPFIPDPYDPQSLNRYSYVRNNPMSRTDPSGFFDGCPDCGGFGGGGGGPSLGFPTASFVLPRPPTTFGWAGPSAVGVASPGVAPSELRPDFAKYDESLEARLAAMGVVVLGGGWGLPTDNVWEGILRGLADEGIAMSREMVAAIACGAPATINVICIERMLNTLPTYQLGAPDTPSGNFWYDVAPGVAVVATGGRSGLRLALRVAGPEAAASAARVFWSGIRGGAERAAAWAAKNGGVTLEQYAAARGLRLPRWDPINPASVAAWRQASLDFAATASGDVRVLQGGMLRLDAIWREEFAVLRANPNVTSITAVNPETGATVRLWTR